MEKFITKVGEMSLKVANEKINQTQRNSLKAEFMTSLVEMFKEHNIELHRTTNGLVLKVEGKEHDLHFEIDAVVKGLDYDLITNVDEYNALVQTRSEKATELAEKKAKRIAETKTKSKKV
jgi:ribosome-associated translation inhibitor RaiA